MVRMLSCALVVAWSAVHAHGAMLPVQWDINATIVGVTGPLPEGELENLDVGWSVRLSLQIDGLGELEPLVATEEEFGEARRSLFLAGAFEAEFADNDDLDGYLLVGAGNNIDGSYLPRNFEGGDEADHRLGDLPLFRSRTDDTFDLFFGYFGTSDLLSSLEDFITAPDIDNEPILGAGMALSFQNGTNAFASISSWETTDIPAPGIAAVAVVGVAASMFRRVVQRS
ncbi:MAG: hypothetical protein AAFX05_12260 [Planctomycetota bacterium]